MVSRAQIEELIGPVKLALSPTEAAAHASPGMHARHYSPKTPLVLVSECRLPSTGRGAYLWIECRASAARLIAMPQEPKAYAAALYRVLHETDAEGWDWIAVERPPLDSPWDAIRDRLERAAAR